MTKRGKVLQITCRGAAMVPLSKLKHFQAELKTLSKNQYERLRNAIAKHGFSFPVAVWQSRGTNHIIDGHQRVFTVSKMLEEGWTLPGKRLPVDWIEARTKKEAKEKVLLAASQYGRYEEDSVAQFIAVSDLDFAELKLVMDLPQIHMGKLEGHFRDVDPKDDEIPEPPKKAIAKVGDLWELGDHRLLCGDATSQKTFDGLYPLMATDPPYGVNYSGENPTMYYGGRQSSPKLKMTSDSNLVTAVSVIDKALSCLNSQMCFMFCAPQLSGKILEVLHHRKYKLVALICWAKNRANFEAMGATYKAQYELAWLMKKAEIRFFGPTNETTLWQIDMNKKNEFHPTQKPVELMARVISNHTKEGEEVLDPFLGAGSTMIAAEKLNRRCSGIEIEPRYADVCIERWESFTGGKAKRKKS